MSEQLEGQVKLEVEEVKAEEAPKTVEKPKKSKAKKEEVNWQREHQKERRESNKLRKEIETLQEELAIAKNKHEVLFHSEQKAKRDLQAQAENFMRAQSLLADGIINVLSMYDLAIKK